MEPRWRPGMDGSGPKLQLHRLQSGVQWSVELRLRGDIAGQSGHQLFDRCRHNRKNWHRSGLEGQAVGRGLLSEGVLLFRSGKQLRRCPPGAKPLASFDEAYSVAKRET